MTQTPSPRVSLTYTVNGEQRELPFVIGVIGDFAGDPESKPPPLRQRKFVAVDGADFDAALRAIRPRLVLRVADRIGPEPGSQIEVELRFAGMEDFSPDRIVERVEPMRRLLEIRQRLATLLERVDGRDHVADLLDQILGAVDEGADPEPPEAAVGVGGADQHEPGSPAGLLRPPLVERIVESMHLKTAEAMQEGRVLAEEFLRQIRELRAVSRGDASRTVTARIRQIDAALSAQLDEIMHHPSFLALEGSWRGLHFLARRAAAGALPTIRVLNASRQDLQRDLDRAADVENTALHDLVLEELHHPFGEPYGVLIGDYSFSHRVDDMQLLEPLARIAALAHAPFVAAASPEMLGLRSVTDLGQIGGRLDKLWDAADYVKWRAFRDSDASRYAALVLPRTLARPPYRDATANPAQFAYREAIDTPDVLVWSSAAYAYGRCLADAFSRHAWGSTPIEYDLEVRGLPGVDGCDDWGFEVLACPVELAISDQRAFALVRGGLLPISYRGRRKPYIFFASTNSCQALAAYERRGFGEDAHCSTRLDYTVCALRFVAYLKVIVRNLIGTPWAPRELEDILNGWIKQYVDPSAQASADRAHKPLAEARVAVQAADGRPEVYQLVAWLKPHFRLERPNGWLRFDVDLPQGRAH